jgi:hypothetical protein
MSPASYLTAPPRVAAPSIAAVSALRATIGRRSVFWIALIVGSLAIVASVVFMVMRALELWRAAKGFLTAFGDGTDEFARRVDALASRDAPELDRLEPALARLRRSSAQLAALRDALERVREQASGALLLYPRK